MKLNKFFSALMLIGAVAFAACTDTVTDTDNGNEGKDSTQIQVDTIAIPDTIDIPAGALTVPEARELCAKLDSGVVTPERYYVHGWVTRLDSKHAEGIQQYGNGTFYLAEHKIATTDDKKTEYTYSSDEFEAYQVFYLDSTEFLSPDQVQEGDYVVVYGKLVRVFEDAYETEGKGKSYIYDIAHSDAEYVEPEIVIPEQDTLTIADILYLSSVNSIPKKENGFYQRWVKGYIVGSYNYDLENKFVIGTDNAVLTNILIADDPECTDTYAVATVKLAKGVYRDALNLQQHPENYKKAICLYGTIEQYCGVGGIVDIKDGYLNGVRIDENAGDTTGGGEIGDLEYAADEISVSQMLEIGANLAAGDTTDYYKVKGIVKAGPQVNLGYGSATFYITDGAQDLYCYNIKGLNDEALVSGEQIQEGDVVTVYARLYNYVKEGQSPVLEMIKGYLTYTSNTFDPSTVTGPKEITVAEALAIGKTLDGDSQEMTTEQYILTGTITSIPEGDKGVSTTYGNVTFYIKDNSSTEEFYIYRLYYLDNKKYTASDPTIKVGDIVKVVGQIQNYKGTIELKSGYVMEHIY